MEDSESGSAEEWKRQLVQMDGMKIRLTRMFNTVLEGEIMPEEWRMDVQSCVTTEDKTEESYHEASC